MTGERVVVIGGSVAGLATALFLARRGHRVLVFERDSEQVPPNVGAIADWTRRPTPQAQHSHAFLARARQILNREAPEVLDGLLAAGAVEIPLACRPPAVNLDIAHQPSDDDMVAVACRRSTFEWVLRRAVASHPNVALSSGVAVTGLTVDSTGAVPEVIGVRTDAGDVDARMVIDAAGRRTPVDAWLKASGVSPLMHERTECGIAYYSRFYEQLSGADLMSLNRGYTGGGSFDRYSCLVFPADNRTFSITFGVLPEDRSVHGLRDARAFDAAASAIPIVASWLARGAAAPISTVASMTGLANEMRRVVADDRPLVLGVHKVGDAAATTNPAHSRGCTLALDHARACAELIDQYPDRSPAQTLAMDRVLDEVQAPWVHDSISQDAHRLFRWRPGHPPPPELGPAEVSNGLASLAAQTDAVVWRRFTRAQQLLELPSSVLRDPDVVARSRRVESSGWRPPPVDAPSHDDLVQIISSSPGPDREPGRGTSVASVAS